MNTFEHLEQQIDNTVELSSICRGEWCRSLESQIDELDSKLHEYIKSGKVNERFCLHTVNSKIQRGYRNLSPDIHV